MPKFNRSGRQGVDFWAGFVYIGGDILCKAQMNREENQMNHYWAWGGKYIGFSEGDYLYSKKGTPIGYISGNEVFGFNGKYLCDIMNDRLIVKKGKCVLEYSRMKPCRMCGITYANYAGYAMYAGYQDFEWEE